MCGVFCCGSCSGAGQHERACFSVNDGLSQGIVQDIIQDRNGYIWFSTWNGLNKYDGYVFTSFKSHPGEGAVLSSNRFVELKESASGDIWCLTQEHCAYLFDIQTSTFIDVLGPYLKDIPSLHFDKIVCLPTGVTWLLSGDGEVCVRVDENSWGRNRPSVSMMPIPRGGMPVLSRK